VTDDSATNGGAWYLFSNMTNGKYNRTLFQTVSAGPLQ
jgi:hypothetical protein